MEVTANNVIVESEVMEYKSDDNESDLNDVCRVCGNCSKQLIPIFNGEGLEHKLSEKISEHLPMMNITQSDILPNNVCYQCASTLISWHELYHTCRRSDQRLKRLGFKIQVKREKIVHKSKNFQNDPHEDLDTESTVVDQSDQRHETKTSDLTEISNTMGIDLCDSYEIANIELDFSDDDDERCLYVESANSSNASSIPEQKGSKLVVTQPSITKSQLRSTQPKSNSSSSVNNSNRLKCSYCSRQFMNHVTLVIHENEKKIIRSNPNVFNIAFKQLNRCGTATKNNEGRFQCNDCQGKFKNKDDITAHITWEHMCKKKFKCDTCEWDCATECDLAMHRSVHSIDEKLICRLCGGRTKTSERFSYESNGLSSLVRCLCMKNFSKHVVNISSNDERNHDLVVIPKHMKLSRSAPLFRSPTIKPEPVREESATTWWEKEEKSTLPAKRSWPRKTICDDCGQNFISNYELKKHRRLHGPKVTCEVCKKEYLKSYINHHMQIHAEVKAYVCEKCGKKFAQLSSLRSHNALEDNIKKLMCNVCGMRFTLSSRLQTHLKNHLPIKPFKCEDCDRDFGYIWQLRQHRIMHSEVRAFKCEYCSKAYKTKKHLKQHWKSTSCNHDIST